MNTSKMERVTWSAKEEAGNFVEVRSRGGIMSYSKGEKKGRSLLSFSQTSLFYG